MTEDEHEARMAAVEKRINERADRIEKILNAKMKVIEERICQDLLKDNFADGVVVPYYKWTYERTLTPRICFTSNKIIYPGWKAYRGELAIKSDQLNESMIYPMEVWLTKEEFTFRRLKGQI